MADAFIKPPSMALSPIASNMKMVYAGGQSSEIINISIDWNIAYISSAYFFYAYSSRHGVLLDPIWISKNSSVYMHYYIIESADEIFDSSITSTSTQITIPSASSVNYMLFTFTE